MCSGHRPSWLSSTLLGLPAHEPVVTVIALPLHFGEDSMVSMRAAPLRACNLGWHAGPSRLRDPLAASGRGGCHNGHGGLRLYVRTVRAGHRKESTVRLRAASCCTTSTPGPVCSPLPRAVPRRKASAPLGRYPPRRWWSGRGRSASVMAS